MTVWYAIPSKRSPEEAEKCLKLWRERGYQIALWRDDGDEPIAAGLTMKGVYPGYHAAVNTLCRQIRALDSDAEWIVTGGDDMRPDPNKTAVQIGTECTEHFGGTFGVMQPIGDRWAHPERICGSPWMGREFCRRMYRGQGPFCEAYPHMWGDEEMHDITLQMGILWQREDLAHYHEHFQRPVNHRMNQRPPWMVRNDTAYARYQPVFASRKRHGFPGHEPIA